MESTPADNTRARSTSRAESSSSIEELGDATVVARVRAPFAEPVEAAEVDRTLAMLPRPTPPPALRTFERATAPPPPPNSQLAETEVGALLSAFRQLQATLLAESHATRAETRGLAQRVAQIEQGQSAPFAAIESRGVELCPSRTRCSSQVAS